MLAALVCQSVATPSPIAPAQAATGIISSTFYSFAGRNDTYVLNDNGFATYFPANTLITVSLPTTGSSSVTYNEVPIVATDPSGLTGQTPNSLSQSITLTGRWGAGAAVASGLLYVIGGVGGGSALPYLTTEQYTTTNFADAFISISPGTPATAVVMAGTGGPTDPGAANLGAGFVNPVVFADSTGSFLYVTGGVYYATSARVGYSTVYQYDIMGATSGTPAWYSYTATVASGSLVSTGYATFAAVSNGAVIVGGQTGAGDSAQVLVLDVSQAPALTYTPAAAAPDPRESAGLFINTDGTTYLVLGAAYDNLTQYEADNYTATTDYALATALPTGSSVANAVVAALAALPVPTADPTGLDFVVSTAEIIIGVTSTGSNIFTCVNAYNAGSNNDVSSAIAVRTYLICFLLSRNVAACFLRKQTNKGASLSWVSTRPSYRMARCSLSLTAPPRPKPSSPRGRPTSTPLTRHSATPRWWRHGWWRIRAQGPPTRTEPRVLRLSPLSRWCT